MLPVIRSITVLLQEVIFDQFGHFQCDFICFCQWSLSEIMTPLFIHVKRLQWISETRQNWTSEQIFFRICFWLCLCGKLPFRQAVQSLPGPLPPAESPSPWYAKVQIQGSACRNIHPGRGCICCSWWASWRMGSASSEPASYPNPRTPKRGRNGGNNKAHLFL